MEMYKSSKICKHQTNNKQIQKAIRGKGPQTLKKNIVAYTYPNAMNQMNVPSLYTSTTGCSVIDLVFKQKLELYAWIATGNIEKKEKSQHNSAGSV